MNMTETAHVVLMATVCWPIFKPIDATYEVWERLLGDLDNGAVIAAIDSLAAEGREFAPSPGQVRQKAIEISNPAIPTADEAWAEILSEVHRVGYVGTPSFSHETIERAVRTFGWRSICSEEEMIIRAHFMKVWPEIMQRFGRQTCVPPSAAAVMATTSTPALPARPVCNEMALLK
jgi:hypothetical protein